MEPQIPLRDQVEVEILWPNMEQNPQVRGEFVYLGVADTEFVSPRPDRFRMSFGSQGYWGERLILTITYDAGHVFDGVISVEWSDDQIERHLLGWYKDGGLTEQRSEATRVRFSPDAPDFVWTLPAHPNTLRRLDSCTQPCRF